MDPHHHRALDRRAEAPERALGSLKKTALLLLLALVASPALANPAEGDEQPPYAVKAALARLAPQRPGKVDLYALVVGGDAEAVFRREVETVRDVLDERLGT